MDANVKGLVRALAVPTYAEGDFLSPALNPRGELIVSQGLPELTEIVRQGSSWYCNSTPGAAVTSWPTTGAGFSIYNDEPASGKCYVIDSFGCFEIVTDATQQNSLIIAAQNSIVGATARPADGGTFKTSLSGRAAYDGKSRCTLGMTIVDAGWTPHGPSSPGATAFAGAVWRVTEFLARGLYIVPPAGGLFSIVAIKSVSTASQIRYFIRWHEVQLSYKT